MIIIIIYNLRIFKYHYLLVVFYIDDRINLMDYVFVLTIDLLILVLNLWGILL